MKKILWNLVAIYIFVLFLPMLSLAGEKPQRNVALIIDREGSAEYQELVRQEIDALLGTRFNVAFAIYDIEEKQSIAERRSLLTGLMEDPAIDMIVGLSTGSSVLLSEMKRYSKPVIAGAILDRNLQGVPMNGDGASGIGNFNYIESPFDVRRDLVTFQKLYQFKHLGVVYGSDETTMFHLLFTYFGKLVESLEGNIRLSMVEIEPGNIEGSLQAMPDDIDAVYLPPLFLGDKKHKMEKLIGLLNDKRLPTFALLGEESVRKGAMASIAPERNLHAMSRRIAINLLDIATGQDAGTLPVQVSHYVENFVVNVSTLRKIGHYPSWTILNEARLVRLGFEEEGEQLKLIDVIKEALRSNLSLQIKKLDTATQSQDVGLAKSVLLPQVSLETSYDVIDKNRADGEPSSPAPNTWSAGGRISQTLFSDDNFSNYSISKLLLESQKYQEKADVLDTVVDATEAFINLLFARSNQIIQNDNLAVTRKNLDIARSKESVGSVGASEVHRWESEQAANKISLNDSYRDVRLAKLALNRILNRPIDQPINAVDIQLGSSIELLITDRQVYSYLENIQQLAFFSDFLLDEADRHLPELKEIEAIVKSQQREVLNRKRAFYLPDIQLQGQIDTILDEHGTDFETPSDLDHPWSISAVASWPLYAGSSRKFDLEKSRLRLRQSRLEAEDLRKQLHLQVSSNLETAAVSAREVSIAKQGLASAAKNFEIIQAGYAEGRNSIADLIDAQNAKRSAERGESVAKYQFVLDFLLLERSVGTFHFLASDNDRMAFLERLKEYMESREHGKSQ